MFGIIILLKNVQPRFIFIILVDGNRLQTVWQNSNHWRIDMIRSVPVPYTEKQPHTTMFPPPNFTAGLVFLRWYQCILTSEHGVYDETQRVQFWSLLTRFSRYSTGLSKWFSSTMESCVVNVHAGHGGWAHYFLFSLKSWTVVLAVFFFFLVLHKCSLVLGKLVW